MPKIHFPPKFDLKLAIELGNLIKSAQEQYQLSTSQGDWRLPDGYDLIRTIDYSTTRFSQIKQEDKLAEYLQRVSLPREMPENVPVGFIARSGKKVYVIFRGTENSLEWATNIHIKLTSHPALLEGAIHEGFLNLYLNIREDVLETVTALAPGLRMVLAGYSLGSTFASLAAFDIEANCGYRIHSIYTFGSPRLADDQFASAFNARFGERSFRIANSSDMVTEVPFPTEFARFVGGYFSHLETPVMFNIQHNDRLKNHELDTYLSALAATRENPVKALIRRML